jgi:7,8-dihydroneopterin aldolase/epimerase/oxygenase
MKSKIILSGMEFYAYHGCFAEEKIIGTRFKVDVVLHCNMLEAAKNDDLDKTINYQSVYADIKKILKKPANILEHICYTILIDLKEKYPVIEKAEVTVYKLNPSIGGKTEWVAVSLEE